MTGEELLKVKYNGKLHAHYDAATFQVLAALISGFTRVPVTKAAADFKSHHNNQAVKCSIKAQEGYVYFVETGLMFLPKPVHHIRYEDIAMVVFSRVSTAASRTFDMRVTYRNTVTPPVQFAGLDREEFSGMAAFFKLRGVRVRNEVSAEEQALAALQGSSPAGGKVVNVGNDSDDDEDSEEDEDFVAGEESDVGEEFDEEYQSEGDGDQEDADADAGGEEDADEE